MSPILTELQLFGRLFAVRAFGLFVAAGFVVGLVVTLRLAARAAERAPAGSAILEVEHAIELALWSLLAGILGARLAYVIVADPGMWGDCLRPFASIRGPGAALRDCLRPLRFWQDGGLVYYGALAGALLAAVAYVAARRLGLLSILDVFAPGLAIGHAIGRIGCFLAGCCFGRPVPGWLAPIGVGFPEASVAYQELSGAGGRTAPLHATQLYEAAGELVLFGLLLRLTGRRAFAGQVFASYLLGYAVLRFGLEYLRGDPRRGSIATGPLAGLSTSQAASLAAILVALLLLGVGYLQARARPAKDFTPRPGGPMVEP